MFMKISFNLCFIVNIRNVIYCIDLRCSHNIEGQICQDSSISVEIGTRLEKQVLTFRIPGCLYGFEMHNSPFCNFLFFLKYKHHIYSVSYGQWDTGHLIWNSNKIIALNSHKSIHNWNLMMEYPSIYLMWMVYSRQSYEQTS